MMLLGVAIALEVVNSKMSVAVEEAQRHVEGEEGGGNWHVRLWVRDWVTRTKNYGWYEKLMIYVL